MTEATRISSPDKSRFIEVEEVEPGVFILRRFTVKFDPEEEVEYAVKSLPDPESKFGDEASAMAEAERLLRLPD